MSNENSPSLYAREKLSPFLDRHFGFLWRFPLTTRSQTSVPRSPLPVPRSPFPVPRFSNILDRCLFFLFKKRICQYHKLYKLYIGWLSEDFYLVFFLFDISCDFSARARVEHAYLGSNLRELVLLTYVSNGNKRQYLRIKFELLYLPSVNGNHLQPIRLCSARLIHMRSLIARVSKALEYVMKNAPRPFKPNPYVELLYTLLF